MTDAELLGRWYLILGIAGVLVVVVAALLITILVTARRIEQAAARSHRAVRKIVENTQVIWELDTTNAVAWQLREGARSIRRHAEEIGQALQAPAGPRA
ncbi:MAG: hypothetical protein ACT4P5_20425 [Armatimonadota bacterium]